jgi:hypothetical protein
MIRGFLGAQEKLAAQLKSEAGIREARRSLIRANLPSNCLTFLESSDYAGLCRRVSIEVAHAAFVDQTDIGVAGPSHAPDHSTATSDANNIAAHVVDKTVDPTGGMAPLSAPHQPTKRGRSENEGPSDQGAKKSKC